MPSFGRSCDTGGALVPPLAPSTKRLASTSARRRRKLLVDLAPFETPLV